jgi:hypothetical protein
MTDTTWTPDELAEFDEITLGLSSPNQLTRINARLRIGPFEKAHGKAKLEAMFAVLKNRDAKGKNKALR